MTRTSKAKQNSGVKAKTAATVNLTTDSLATRMRRRRLQLGWTQQELADRVATTQAVVQKIENHKSQRPRILEEIAEALGVSPAWLMYGEQGELDVGVDEEALAVARTWNSLEEPHRSAMRDVIYKMLDRSASRGSH